MFPGEAVPMIKETIFSNFESVICDHMSQIKSMGTFSEISLRWMSQNTYADKLRLVQVMDLCCQAASHWQAFKGQ